MPAEETAEEKKKKKVGKPIGDAPINNAADVARKNKIIYRYMYMYTQIANYTHVHIRIFNLQDEEKIDKQFPHMNTKDRL